MVGRLALTQQMEVRLFPPQPMTRMPNGKAPVCKTVFPFQGLVGSTPTLVSMLP